MKKTLLISILAMLGLTQAAAQEYEYVPFVREGVKWVYIIYNTEWGTPDPDLPTGYCYRTLEIKGDTIINGMSYKAMHKYSCNAIDTQNDTVPIYLREEDKIVYGIIPDGKIYYDCPINISWINNEYNGQEFVVYDFNDQASFWEDKSMDYDPTELNGDFEILSTDTITLGTHRVKRYLNRYGSLDFYLVEGVGIDWPGFGYTLNFFMGYATFLPVYHFSHVIEDGQIIYKGFNFEPNQWNAIDEVVAERPSGAIFDDQYYNLMGQPVGKDVPTTPGIYIHHGKKIVIR
jgi:hypothetical protein